MPKWRKHNGGAKMFLVVLFAFIAGTFLYIKFTFFNKQMQWKAVLSIQLSILGIILIAFAIFMFTPVSNRLIDILFSQ